MSHQAKSPITTHVLDTTTGLPGQGIKVEIHKTQELGEPNGDSWTKLGEGITNDDGRISDLLDASQALENGLYKLCFYTGEYFKNQSRPVFYPKVDIVFFCNGEREHYHIPLLLSPYSYSTYRGS